MKTLYYLDGGLIKVIQELIVTTHTMVNGEIKIKKRSSSRLLRGLVSPTSPK